MYKRHIKGLFLCFIFLSGIFISDAFTADDTKPVGDVKPTTDVKKSVGVKTSGVAFINYIYDVDDLGKGKGFNRFDLDRIYLTFESAIADKIKMKVTTDIYQNAKSTSFKTEDGTISDNTDVKEVKIPSYYDGWSIRLKNAYIDLDFIPITTIRFGMMGTPWISTEEKAWGYRFVKPTFADSEKLFSSADLGAGLILKFPANCGEAMLMVLNGTGYLKPEDDKYKDVVSKITIYPYPNVSVLKGLSLSGYYYYGKRYNGDELLNRNRLGGLLSFNCDFVNAGGEFNMSKDQSLDKDKNIVDTNDSGFSAFGELKFAKFLPAPLNNLGILARLDSWDPDTKKEDDAHNAVITGLTCSVMKNVRAVIDLQKTSYKAKDKDATSQIMFQMEVKF